MVVNKYGEDVTSQPELGDAELWTEAVGGVKKGRIYGFGAPYDPQLAMTGIPSTIRSTELGTSEEVYIYVDIFSLLQTSCLINTNYLC